MIGAAHLVAMVATTPDHPCLPVIDQVVAGGGSADDVLAVLQQWSAWGLPPFCICERTPTGFRLLLRGDFEVRPDGEPPITVREEPLGSKPIGSLTQMAHILAIRSETESLFSQGLSSNWPLSAASSGLLFNSWHRRSNFCNYSGRLMP